MGRPSTLSGTNVKLARECALRDPDRCRRIKDSEERLDHVVPKLLDRLLILMEQSSVVANPNSTTSRRIQKPQPSPKRVSGFRWSNARICEGDYGRVKNNIAHCLLPAAFRSAILSSIAWLMNPLGRFSNWNESPIASSVTFAPALRPSKSVNKTAIRSFERGKLIRLRPGKDRPMFSLPSASRRRSRIKKYSLWVSMTTRTP
jgi:hypothetical protein